MENDNIYQCCMIKRMTFTIKASSEQEAEKWLQKHGFLDVMSGTTNYELVYDNQVLGPSCAESADINLG